MEKSRSPLAGDKQKGPGEMRGTKRQSRGLRGQGQRPKCEAQDIRPGCPREPKAEGAEARKEGNVRPAW